MFKKKKKNSRNLEKAGIDWMTMFCIISVKMMDKYHPISKAP